MKCSVCNRERKEGQTITLTAEERQAMSKASLGPVSESYFYCQACYRILTDRVQGAQLYRGLLQASLARSGVRNSNHIASRFYQFLVDRAAKKPVS